MALTEYRPQDPRRALLSLSAKAKGYKDDVQGYLKAHSSVWHVVGRVCFHLAEEKRDPEYPFAFIATVTAPTSRLIAASSPDKR